MKIGTKVLLTEDQFFKHPVSTLVGYKEYVENMEALTWKLDVDLDVIKIEIITVEPFQCDAIADPVEQCEVEEMFREGFWGCWSKAYNQLKERASLYQLRLMAELGFSTQPLDAEDDSPF